MLLLMVVNYLKLSLAITRLNLSAATQYRINFFMGIVMHTIMISTLYSIWFIFFSQFPSINGWEFSDTALLLGIVTVGFALIEIFAEGAEHLSEIIASGKLDYYLLLPKPVLWTVSVSESVFASIGNLLVGCGMLYFSGVITVAKLPILSVVTLLSTILLYNFIVINNSLAFYFGNVDRLVNSLTSGMWDLLFYPQAAFSGLIKVIIMTILPAFFIGTVPAHLVKEFSWAWLLGLVGFTLLSSGAAAILFKRGLRRYESGNLFTSKL